MEFTDIINGIELDEDTEMRLREAFNQIKMSQKQRQHEGIQKARENGIKFGRPRARIKNIDQICQMYSACEISLTDAAKLTGVSRSTIYRRIREINEHL